jgi:threonine dehydratase
MSLSLAKGKPVTLESVNTIADSLGPPMSLPYGFSLCASHVDEIVLVTDDQICAGMVVLLEEAKLAVEPAAGASMAGILFPLKDKLLGKKVGLVVCGANIDAKSYKDFITRGSDFLKITDY